MSTANLSTTFDLTLLSPASWGGVPVLDLSTWPWGLCSLSLVLLSFKVDHAGLGLVILLILVLYSWKVTLLVRLKSLHFIHGSAPTGWF